MPTNGLPGTRAMRTEFHRQLGGESFSLASIWSTVVIFS